METLAKKLNGFSLEGISNTVSAIQQNPKISQKTKQKRCQPLSPDHQRLPYSRN